MGVACLQLWLAIALVAVLDTFADEAPPQGRDWLRGRSQGATGGGASEEPTFAVLDARWLFPALYVPEAGLVYCGIEKVASSEWKRALRWMLGIPSWDSYGDNEVHNPFTNRIPHLYNQSPQTAWEIINDQDWVKIVVVRDPVERALSGFLNKCLGTQWFNCPLHHTPEKVPGMPLLPGKGGRMRRARESLAAVRRFAEADPKKAFLAFAEAAAGDIREKEEKDCQAINVHYRPQHCYCGLGDHGLVSAFRVIPFSNMTEEAAAAMQDLAVPTAERREKIAAFVRERFSQVLDAQAKKTGASSDPLKERYFSEEALEVLHRAYAQDYQLFGPWL